MENPIRDTCLAKTTFRNPQASRFRLKNQTKSVLETNSEKKRSFSPRYKQLSRSILEIAENCYRAASGPLGVLTTAPMVPQGASNYPELQKWMRKASHMTIMVVRSTTLQHKSGPETNIQKGNCIWMFNLFFPLLKSPICKFRRWEFWIWKNVIGELSIWKCTICKLLIVKTFIFHNFNFGNFNF